ncbi:transcription factor ETV7-like [Cylas formicarius]|uniref:transcription factor ETV7-like n=1 Tax=Cylas formicarius TaxID=197179 RepID=UPI002958A8B4|nr:transcription factor ETV7-like [Cylas formicarius]XP_060533600.1 transcription factor ETV7-like [Cylas formicarius]
MALRTAEGPIRYEWDRFPAYRNSPSPSASYDNDDNLPKDPRQWTREHVLQWLRHITTVHGLPDVPSSRFLMNGKALCLMSPGMFLSRVPLGGKLLYKDFQLRLCAAMYSRN